MHCCDMNGRANNYNSDKMTTENALVLGNPHTYRHK